MTETAVTHISALSRELERQYPARRGLWLEFGGCWIQVRSNSEPLLAALRDYFGDLVQPDHAASPDVLIRAYEAPPPDFGQPLRDWPREAGKAGQKEQFFDLPDGRVVFKVRTKMQFLIGRDDLVAVGPCLANDNQIINFINSQCISRRLHEGWSLCHAAGVALHAGPGGSRGRGVGIAARAGAGKSTLALHLISSGLSFVSNDRLLLKSTNGRAEMAGIPKMPRVNPGTLLNNPDLHGILPPERQRELEQQPREKLWELEEKYDVLIDKVYGKGRTLYRADLVGLVILNWSWKDSSAQTRFEPVELAERRDLLELVMKSPGVFHRDASGASLSAQKAADAARTESAGYLEAARHTRVWEATGRPQFDLGVSFCRRLLEA